MPFDPALHSQVHVALAEFSALVAGRDPRLIDRFAPDALLAGSESGELAVGREALQALFSRLFSLDRRISWEWDDVRAEGAGDLCWFFAEGRVVLAPSDGAHEGEGDAAGIARAPYRLSGVLQRQDGRWIWRQFHGSEPA